MLLDPKWNKQLVESKTVETLKRGRARVELCWCPFGGVDAYGGVCPSVAITEQFSLEEMVRELPPALDFFRQAICGGAIPDWNDTPGRTKAEVLAAFERAIELARREEET